MSPPNMQVRQRPTKTFNFLPNSSYVETAGQLWDVSKDQEQGSTVTPMVWYGTANAGLRVRDKARSFLIVEGTIPSARRDNSDTRPSEALDSKLAEIRMLLRAGDVVDARKIFFELPSFVRAEPTAKPLARALVLPKAKLSTVGSGHKISRKWIREHSDEYKGRWVALIDDQLLGDDDSCISLRKRIGSERDNLAGVQFLFVG